MQVAITWPDICLRLTLTLLAGVVIGANRGEHGRPAGLRTTVLVALTAAASLILANLLLGTGGRPWDAYTTMDVMRLPLGVLTGMGFIGAGAILHKGNLVVGVTTAATLWFTTLMGFCFGAGQIGLGLVLLGLGIFVLWALEWVETNWKQGQEATLTVFASADKLGYEELEKAAQAEGFKLSLAGLCYSEGETRRSYHAHWHGPAGQIAPPPFLEKILGWPGVKRVEWTPIGKS